MKDVQGVARYPPLGSRVIQLLLLNGQTKVDHLWADKPAKQHLWAEGLSCHRAVSTLNIPIL